MKIGVIADDFTGASDIALTLVEGGMNVSMFTRLPSQGAGQDMDAAVIALKTRTASVKFAVSQALDACDWLLAQGAQQIIYKVCSTFDSTEEGNIGPVLDALLDRLEVKRSLVCPAFPENGRSVYQGHLFVQDKLLSESGMESHPLTPMTDPDLRRVLRAQCRRPVEHVAVHTVTQGGQAIVDAMPDEGHVILDAISDDHLLEIARAARNERLLCGGSGIALGLPANFGCKSGAVHWSPVTGPGVVLSGSCSRATRAQVAAFQKDAPAHEIRANDLIEGRLDAKGVADWVLRQPTPPLVFSSADPKSVSAAQRQFGQERVADVIERFFADLATALVGSGLTRMVVAGGETSGAVISGICANVLDIGPRIAAGVPLARIPRPVPVALALKSGNFGDEVFFSRALALMEGEM